MAGIVAPAPSLTRLRRQISVPPWLVVPHFRPMPGMSPRSLLPRSSTTRCGGRPCAASDGHALDLPACWRLFVEGALRFETARMLEDGSPVSIWLPPGDAELSDEQLASLEALIARDLDADPLAALHVLYKRFEVSREARPEHSYLSLFAAVRDDTWITAMWRPAPPRRSSDSANKPA